MINLHESMGPGQDQIQDPWICNRSQYHYWKEDTAIQQNIQFSIWKGPNLKIMKKRVTVLAFCMSFYVTLHLCEGS